MQEKPTDELNSLISDIKPGQLDAYLKENKSYMRDAKKAFYYYMKDTLEEKGIRLKDVYLIADVSDSYGGQIIRMEKHTSNRDLIIRLCIGGHFTWKETSRALKLYGFTELYAKNTRDSCIIAALNGRIFDPDRIDELLMEKGFEGLSNE